MICHNTTQEIDYSRMKGPGYTHTILMTVSIKAFIPPPIVAHYNQKEVLSTTVYYYAVLSRGSINQ